MGMPRTPLCHISIAFCFTFGCVQNYVSSRFPTQNITPHTEHAYFFYVWPRFARGPCQICLLTVATGFKPLWTGLPGPGPPRVAQGIFFYVSLRAQYVLLRLGMPDRFGEATTCPNLVPMRNGHRPQVLWKNKRSSERSWRCLMCSARFPTKCPLLSGKVSVTFWQGFQRGSPCMLKSVHALRITFRYVSSRLPSILINPARHDKTVTLVFYVSLRFIRGPLPYFRWFGKDTSKTKQNVDTEVFDTRPHIYIYIYIYI